MEWVRIKPDEVVVASERTYFLHSLGPIGDPFADTMDCPGSPESTHKLLLGAVVAARRDAPPRHLPPLTVPRYVWRLAGHQITTSNTPRLMGEVAERFDAEGRADLAAHARKVAHEEDHGGVVLLDIGALGYDPQGVMAAFAPPVSVALIDLLREYVRGPEPIRSIGWMFGMEQSALARTPDVIAAIERVLPPGVDATRTLRIHSSGGDDDYHVRDSVDLVSTLPPGDRVAVVQAVYETTLTIRTPLPREMPPEEWLEARLAPLRTGNGDGSRRAVLAWERGRSSEGR